MRKILKYMSNILRNTFTFVKMKIIRNWNYYSLNNELFSNSIMSFFIIGIPFFIETFLTLQYPETNSKLNICTPARICVKLLELWGIFLTIYVSFETVTSNSIRKLIVFCWLLVIFIPVNLDLASVYITGTFISNNFMFAIFNSHFCETLFIIEQYIVLFFINCCIVIYAFNLKSKESNFNNKYAVFALIFCAYLIKTSNFLPHHSIIVAFDAYIEDLKDIEACNKYQKTMTDIKTSVDLNQNETYVFVIGESVDRKHMGIYDYTRQTTPYFEKLKLKNELFIFRNISAKYTLTSAAVKAMIQFVDTNKEKYSLIRFFKDSGFKTFWFSNQDKIDLFDNSVMRFGKTCDEYAFIYGKKITYSSEAYNIEYDDVEHRSLLLDEDLLKYFYIALKDPAKKKFIVIHLYGSHYPINLRYPKSFEKFKLPDQYYDKTKALCVCYYDNSILYTDFILNKIISALKQNKGLSWMLYLSDHGQDVNDTENCKLSSRTYPNGYEVPFIVWISQKYKEENSDFVSKWNFNIPYTTDLAAYSIIDLARRKHESIDLNNSIFQLSE